MDTKGNTKLFLLEKSPAIFTSAKEQEFKGSYPPTGEQILLQYTGYHKYLQEVTKRQSCVNEAINLVRKDVEGWWDNTGILLKSHQGIKKMVSNLIKDFKCREMERT